MQKTPQQINEQLAKIRKGVAVVRADQTPDGKDFLEKANLENEKLRAAIENDWLLIGLRKSYGKNIIRFLWVYFIFSSTAIVSNGFGLGGFRLPDMVLAALVGTTAVSVIGVVGTVAAGLFRPPT